MEPPDYQTTVRFSFAAEAADASEPPPPADAASHVALAHRGAAVRVPARALPAAGPARFVLLSDVRRAVPAASALVDAAGWMIPAELDAAGDEARPVRWRLPGGGVDPAWEVFVPDRRDRRDAPRSRRAQRKDDKEERERQSAAAYASALDNPLPEPGGPQQTLGVGTGSTGSGIGPSEAPGSAGNAPDSARPPAQADFPAFAVRALPSLREHDLDAASESSYDPASDPEPDPDPDGDAKPSSSAANDAALLQAVDARLAQLSDQITALHHALSDRIQAVLMRLHTVYNRLGALEAGRRPGQPTAAGGAPAVPPPPLPFRNNPEHGTLPPAFREGGPPRRPVEGQGKPDELPPPYN